MAQSKRTSKTSVKKRAPAKKRKISGTFPKIPVFSILFYLALLFFFILSIAVLFYVIFFQVVVADEWTEHDPVSMAVLIIDDMGNNSEPCGLSPDLNLTSIELAGAGELPS